MAMPLVRGRARALALYLTMLAATLGLFVWICWLGNHGDTPATSSALTVAAAPHLIERLLLSLGVIILSAKLIGQLFAYLKSPPVIGEIVAGILLGPSFLGRIAPEAAEFVLPKVVAPGISVLAQLGVILYMFFVGLEVDIDTLKKSGHQAVAISHASIVVPFILGAGLALFIHPILSSDAVPFTHFALFCGAAMSVTAFPVLARILSDRGEQTSRLGALALACAAVDDISAWCLLAGVVSVVSGRPDGVVFTLVATIAYVGLMWWLVRPRVARWAEARDAGDGGLTKGVLTTVFVALLGSALVTEYIGIHALFGAFALGVVVPAKARVTHQLTQGLQNFVIILFLPAFFAYTGLRTQIGLVSSGGEWLLCGVVLATACAGKFGGTFAAARLSGMDLRDSASLGVLMNTRGLMELIVLNLGLDLGVITPTFFAMMVLMAVTTTFATTPLLYVIQNVGRSLREILPGDAGRAESAE